jgi:hypothetical protein
MAAVKGFESYVGHGNDYRKHFIERKGKQIKVATNMKGGSEIFVNNN